MQIQLIKALQKLLEHRS